MFHGKDAPSLTAIEVVAVFSDSDSTPSVGDQVPNSDLAGFSYIDEAPRAPEIGELAFFCFSLQEDSGNVTPLRLEAIFPLFDGSILINGRGSVAPEIFVIAIEQDSMNECLVILDPQRAISQPCPGSEGFLGPSCSSSPLPRNASTLYFALCAVLLGSAFRPRARRTRCLTKG